MAFTTQPGIGDSGAPLVTQPVVSVQDLGGNTVTGNTSTVALTLTVPGTATLACTTSNSRAAVAGVATFTGCSVDVAGSYSLTAADGGLTGAISTTFTISTGVAAKLAFTTQPSGSTGGAGFGTQPVLTVQDAAGNTVVGDTSAVTLALTVPGSATLACTPSNTKAAVAGVATFAGCAINLANTYTITATASGLTSAVSNNVVISVGAAAKVAFTTQPSGSTGGVAFGTQPVVTVQDAGGNTIVGNTSTVALTITVPGAATLACTTSNSRAAVAGVATFAGCKIDVANTYTLTASDGSLASGQSTSLTITVGAASKLGFTTQPSGAVAGVALATQPVVKVQDLGGNTIVGDTSAVTLALVVPGTATLACTTNPQGAVAGVASFSGCSVNIANTYTLLATDGSLTSATSSSFAIVAAAAAKLGFTTQPGNGTGGVALGAQPVVSVQDTFGNTVTTDISSVTLSITTPAGALACTTNPKAAVAGVATFAGCVINLPGTYTLTAVDGSLTSAVSNSLTITVGAAAKLAVTTQPSPTGSTGGLAFAIQPVVTVQDAGGNTVTATTSR